jgi:hypothetical protein
MARWHQIYPGKGAVTIAGITAPTDDVRTWFRALWPLNSGNPRLLTDLVKLADGQLPSHFETYVGNSRIKIEPGLDDLPKRIRLALPLRQLHHETSDSTAVQRADVDEWINADKVQAYQATELLDIRAARGGSVLAEAGLISIAEPPAVLPEPHDSYTVSILRGRFFRTDPSADRADALDAHEDAVDLRTGFEEMPNGNVVENLSRQIPDAVGFTRGQAPSAKDETSLAPFSDRLVEYSVACGPRSSNGSA